VKLGDKLEYILRKIGVKWVWEKIWGGDCKECEKRKRWLNKFGMKEDDVDPASAVDEDEEMDAFLDEILMWRDDEDEK
tara:strand:+ start:437 stop:670 length:234 start_codon:yes stop_codon:yes gene_type:complete